MCVAILIDLSSFEPIWYIVGAGAGTHTATPNHLLDRWIEMHFAVMKLVCYYISLPPNSGKPEQKWLQLKAWIELSLFLPFTADTVPSLLLASDYTTILGRMVLVFWIVTIYHGLILASGRLLKIPLIEC